MNTSLHNSNPNSVKVHKFESFATVTVFDKDLNEVSLFFKNLGEVHIFALMIEEKMKEELKNSLR